MSIVVSESVKSSIINYLGVALAGFYTIFLAPKIFSADYNGLLRLIIEVSLLLGTYMQFGMPLIINKYYYKIFEINKQSTGFDFFIFIVPLIVFCIFLLLNIFNNNFILKALSGNSILFAKYSKYLFILVFCYIYITILEIYSGILHKIVFVNIVRGFWLRCINLIAGVFYYFNGNFETTLQLLTGLTLMALIADYIYVLRLKKFDFSFSVDFLEKGGIKRDMAKYLLYVIISNIGLFLVQKIDILMLGAISNLSSIAYYTTAYFMVNMLLVPYQSILNISFPIIVKKYQHNEHDEVEVLVKENALFSLYLSLIIFIVIAVNIDYIYSVMPNGHEYSIAKYVFLIIGFGKLIDISIGSIGNVLTISKYYHLGLFITIIVSIFSVLSSYFLIKHYNITGAAFAAALTIGFSALFQVLIVYKLLKVQPYSKNTLILVLFSILIAGTVYLIPSFSNAYFMICIKTAIVLLLYFFFSKRFPLCNPVTLLIEGIERKFRRFTRKIIW